MNILYAASEVAPFIKTGGLADVAGSLPPVLAKSDHDVRVVLPLYEGIGAGWRSQMTCVLETTVPLAWRTAYCGIFTLSRGGVTYYFIDNEYYFKRASLYGHYDDGERFAFFSRAVAELPALLDWMPDIVHCNDWQTALVPIYLIEVRSRVPQLAGTKSVFTIHNIEYQGRYGPEILDDVFGLDDSWYKNGTLECDGDLNLVKGAITVSDAVTTVSPTYAQELHYDFYAHGLAGVISANSEKLHGILNGIDTEENDPKTSRCIQQSYSAGRMAGKAVCKAALQRAVGLAENSDVPVVACVSRLVHHKGFDLVAAALPELMNLDIQMVVLGTGDWSYEEAFRTAQQQYPGRFSAQIMYSPALSAAIYAGADVFLMPSISEPCGLAQMIAMRFGTVPVVRETGGLKDSVVPYNKFTGTGNGFTFANATPGDMVWAVRCATELLRHDPAAWRALQKTGMTANFSWARSARLYLELYHSLTGDAVK